MYFKRYLFQQERPRAGFLINASIRNKDGGFKRSYELRLFAGASTILAMVIPRVVRLIIPLISGGMYYFDA